MKNMFFILIAVFASINSFSQDIITLKTGDEIISKVLEVTTDQIKYKKWDNIEGPTYTSLKSEVFMIKYQNGTKDVFKTQESSNVNNVLESNEDLKKNEAVRKLENYVKNKISGPIIKVESFRKTNGVMNNIFGQIIYTINCDIDIKFASDGWKIGNSLEGYWSSFSVYPSEPDLYATGQQYMYVTKLYKRGTLLTLGCVAEMVDTDNGFEVESLSIKTIANHGIVADLNHGNSNQQNETSTYDFGKTLKTSHAGHFNDEVKNESYTTNYIYKESTPIEKNLFYKGKDMSLASSKFGNFENYSEDKVIVKQGDTLSLDLILHRYKDGKKEWDGKQTDYLLSIQIEDYSGKEYYLETFDQVISIRKSDSPVRTVKYAIVVPIVIDPKIMLLCPTGKDLYFSMLVKGKIENKAIWEGFFKFSIE